MATVGAQRHRPGMSVTTAPAENALPPGAGRDRDPLVRELGKADCGSTATWLTTAFSFSGRLMASKVTGPRCSTEIMLIIADLPILTRDRGTSSTIARSGTAMQLIDQFVFFM